MFYKHRLFFIEEQVLIQYGTLWQISDLMRGRGQSGGGDEGTRGWGISQMDMMECLDGHRLQG